MLLVITSSGDATADFLCSKLSNSDVSYIRFDTDRSLDAFRIAYVNGLPLFSLDGRELCPKDVSHVWFRRPEPLKWKGSLDVAEGKFVESEWSEAIEGFLAHIPTRRWMNHPAHNAIASHKLEQLTRAEKVGLSIPDTLVTQNPMDVQQFWSRHKGRVITKPLFGGYLERNETAKDTQIYTNQIQIIHLSNLDCLRNCPTLFQQLIEKRLDIRICVIDQTCRGVGLLAPNRAGNERVDIRRNNMLDVQYVSVRIPSSISSRLIKLTKSYGLRFAAIDMAIDAKGTWIFFELNPNGQWAWLDIAGASNLAQDFERAFRR